MSEPTEKSLITTNAKGAIQPKDHGEMYRMAEQLSKSALVPQALRNKPADTFLTLQAGAELGLAMTQSLKAIHVINGTPALAAETMGALVLGSGLVEDHKVWMSGEGDKRTAHILVKRKGIPTPQELSYSMQQAMVAGLGSNANYKKNPDDMLVARVKSKAYRILFPDVLKNMHSIEELDNAPYTAATASRMQSMGSTEAPAASAPSRLIRRRKVEPDPEPVSQEPEPEPVAVDEVPPEPHQFDPDTAAIEDPAADVF